MFEPSFGGSAACSLSSSSLSSNGCKALNDEKKNKHGDKFVRVVRRPCSLYQTVADIPHRH